MISVVHRYARALSHISPGISAQVTRDDAQARRYVHASANHMASKRMHKAGPALRKRDKHPSRVRGSNGQDSLTERIHRASSQKVRDPTSKFSHANLKSNMFSDRKSTRLNSSHVSQSRMPSSA